MNGLFNPPKYVRYDFLITFIGLLCLGGAWYYASIKNICIGLTQTCPVLYLYVLGVPLTLWGMGEMYNNYKEERELRKLEIIFKKKELFDNLLKNEIINKTHHKDKINSLKKELKDFFDERTEKKEKNLRVSKPI